VPAVLCAALAVVAPARAGTVTTQNSCRWSTDNQWRHLNVDLGGAATPNPAAPGSGISLTGGTMHLQLPTAGDNQIDVKAWLALQGSGTLQGVQVLPLEVGAHADGASSAVDLTLALPDTAWTNDAASTSFRQGTVGTLPLIAAGPNGAPVKPLGSLYLHVTGAPGAPALTLDCQPGTGEGLGPPVSRVPDAFETVAVQDGAASQPPPKATPHISLRSATLRGSRVRVSLQCAGSPCEGTARASTRKLKYTLAAGERISFTLTLRNRPKKVTLKVSLGGGRALSKVLKQPRKRVPS